MGDLYEMRQISNESDDACWVYQRDLTANEVAWLEFLRLASQGTDPPVTLHRVQRLRTIFATVEPSP